MIASTTRHRKQIRPLRHDVRDITPCSDKGVEPTSCKKNPGKPPVVPVVSKVDITTLISKMRDQYHSLRQHYEQQLEDIEQAFEEERKEMLQKNKVGNTMVGTRVSYDKQGELKRLVKDFEYLHNRCHCSA